MSLNNTSDQSQTLQSQLSSNNLSTQASQFESLYEVGKLHYDRGDFEQGIVILKKAADGFFSEKNFSQFLKCQNLLLRMYAEKEQSNDINTTKERLQDLVLKEGFELNSKTYYTLAICALYKDQTETALDYFQKALAIALTTDNKEDICNAIFGIAQVYAMPKIARYAEALKEIYNLQVFFQVYNMPELKVSAQMLNAKILSRRGKNEEALEILWKAYDDLKIIKSVMMTTYLLVALSDLYFLIGEKDLAKMYLQLAARSVDSKIQVHLSKLVKTYMDKIGMQSQNSFDLVFNESNHAVIEKKLGKIDFKNQFILLDLLKLFVQNQGAVYSKEYLVENVWRQSYDPSVHDNKIYVTIKRLRKMIEPDFDKPKYIFRAKNGYFMNKSARILIEQGGGQ